MSTLLAPAQRGRFEKTGEFFKVENGVAYGWAIVSTEKGAPYWDLQDDHIPEDEMVVAALDFMKNSRVGSDQHTGEHVGDIVFGLPVTKGSAALGLVADKTGFLIGYQPQDPVHLDMIARGERTGFSIGGSLLDWTPGEIGKAVWSTAFQNALPDSSFLLVKGKRRMYPVKDKTGKVDAAHVTNALARIAGDPSLSDAEKADLTKKASALKKEAHVEKGSPDPSDVYTPGEVGTQGKPKKKPGKVYRRFKIDEISLVTKPAQEGALVGYVKSAPIRFVKDADMAPTSSQDGHQHIVYANDVDEDGRGSTSGAITSDGEWHTHCFLVGKNGAVQVLDNAGHGHKTKAVADPGTPSEEDSGDHAPVVGAEVVRMSAPITTGSLTPGSGASSFASKSQTGIQEPKMSTMTEQDLAALNKRLARAEKMVDLNDAHRAFAKSLLSDADRDAFIEKTSADREALLKSAIEFTAADGSVYFKSDDPRLIKAAKANDENAKTLTMEKALRRKAEFAKEASESMAKYAGESTVHVAIVEALHTISDDTVRKAAFDVIKAGNTAFTKLGKGNGVTVGTDFDNSTAGELEKAETALKTAVTKYQEANKIGTYAEAFDKASQMDAATRDAFDDVQALRKAAQR